MILEPNAAFDEPFEYDMSGLQLVAGGDDLKTIRVSAVIPDSPAAVAGVRPNDIITDVDGVTSTAFDLARLDSYFKQEGRNISVTVQRGSTPIYLRFTLKRLL
jgi:C-terminal processing protease CtpA/Prc